MKIEKLVIVVLILFSLVGSTSDLSADDVDMIGGPITGFTGGVNATTGIGSLTAVTSCTQSSCIPADPATWHVSSSAGWQVTQTTPVVQFDFTMGQTGYQIITIVACNQVTPACFEQVREVGWLDSYIELTGQDQLIVPGSPYSMGFEMSAQVSSSLTQVRIYIESQFPYLGAGVPTLTLSSGSIDTCELIPNQGSVKLGCQVFVPTNTAVQGAIQVPADHGQMWFSTSWRVEHNYFQPGSESEYPYDGQNTPSGVYGSELVFLPMLIK
ncbi:hypothetical protein KBC79_04485 [Candidatus Woesebacteria bacterium]|nr:hypothetical protein [Candidatus Woesebacteria bacterium]